MYLKLYGWHWKTIWHLLYIYSSFRCHFIAICGFEFELQSGNDQIGSNLMIIVYCDLEILRMTLKNNRTPLLCPLKLCASFRSNRSIPIWDTIRKRTNWVLTSMTLTFDLWLWTFAWPPLLSLVITPENFMMTRWKEHSQKGVTGGRTGGRTDWTIHRAAWWQLKTECVFMFSFVGISWYQRTLQTFKRLWTSRILFWWFVLSIIVYILQAFTFKYREKHYGYNKWHVCFPPW